MLNASSFHLIYCQAVIFTPEMQFNTNKVLSYLLNKYSDRLSADPVSFPIPLDAPAEIPRIILRSDDSQLQLQAGPARLDVVQEAKSISPEELKNFFEFALSVFADYLEAMACQSRRLACIVRRFAPEANGAKYLAAYFCKDRWLADPLNHPSDFELHAAKNFKFGGWLNIGSWFRCKSVNIKFGESPLVPGIIIEQDFNSATVEHEDARPFSIENIRKFFENAPDELQLVVNRYFPL